VNVRYDTAEKKTGAFSRTSPDILDRFLQCFHHTKELYVQMMDLYLIFQYFKGVGMATK